MKKWSCQSNDWHHSFQTDDYLHLMLKRLDSDTPPLRWCEQFTELIRDEFQDSTSQLSLHDLGCNVGHFCRVLPLLPYRIIYNGFDISDTYLTVAKSRYPQYRFNLLDISNDKITQEADVSIISATLEHIEQWELAFTNILSSTRRLALLRSFFGMESMNHLFKNELATNAYPIRQFRFEQIARASEEMGFKVRFVRDRATDSIPQYLGCGITRTQYVAVLRKD